jgi:hypothetical protein
MCKCTPEIRTPFCGRGDCLPPGYANMGEWLGISSDAEAEAAAQASLDRVWAQAVRQSQMTTVPSANTELCADHKWLANSNVRTCGGCLAAKLAEAEAEGREAALRDALVRAKDALNWRDNKIRLRHRDPLGEAEIRALGERVGYGVLMSTASRLWYEKAGGGAFAVGDCLSTVEAADEAAARALSGEGSNQ